MKKFLLCMVLAGLMMPVIAQEKLALNESKSVYANERVVSDLGLSGLGMLPTNLRGTLVDVEGWKSVGTSDGYDRQSQGCIYPMAKIHTDGFIGATWTNEDNPPFGSGSTQTRGIAYAFSKDGGKTWAEADMRVGGIPLYWPSYVQWGPNGEAILGRSADTYEHEGTQILNGLVLMTRENKGVGEWTLRTVPYPAGTPVEDGWVMAWSRMVTGGDNHQYIHIMTHTRKGATCSEYYEGACEPVFYYRTQDGGATWDIEAELVPEVAGIEWIKYPDPMYPSYTDRISIAAHGDVVAVSFISQPYHSYVLKSVDNGSTWNAIKFFHNPVNWYATPQEYSEACYTPTHGNVAVDLNGKVHVAFAVIMVQNAEGDSYSYWPHYYGSFLSYWNEDMPLLDGDNYLDEDIDVLMSTFIDDSNIENKQLIIKSTTPEWPIVGFYTTSDSDVFTIDNNTINAWAFDSYGTAGLFSFPQMAFDKDNKMHLTYLGLLDNGSDDSRWFRHPYHTTRNTDGTWTPTEYLVNWIDLIDKEFAYLTLAGLYDDKMFLMAQTDASAGTNGPYPGEGPDHPAGVNTFYFFYVEPILTPVSIDEVDYTPLTMSVYPNPAKGEANVKMDGRKGNVTVYNMLGQTVYHVENVENSATIPLTNMATGVYFVTVRSGNATATQKLIVK